MELGRRSLRSSHGRTERTQRILEDDSRRIALTVAFGFDAIATCGSLLSAFDPSLATCYIQSAMPNPQRFDPHGLLRQPVLVRFRAFNGLGVLTGLGVLAGSGMVALALVDDSGLGALPLFSEPIACACRGSSPVVLEPDAISSTRWDIFLGLCCGSTDERKNLCGSSESQLSLSQRLGQDIYHAVYINHAVRCRYVAPPTRSVISRLLASTWQNRCNRPPLLTSSAAVRATCNVKIGGCQNLLSAANL